MKFFIMLLLISACGVHKTPPEKDLNDSDGDSISNYQESGMDKYLARVEALPEIKGIMSFGSSRLTITNVRDLKNDSMDLLTWNLQLIQEEGIFHEWTKLRLETLNEMPSIKKGMHEVTLDFESGEASPTSLWLVKKNSSKNLGAWSSRLTLKLSSEQLTEIIQGKSHLSFSTPWLEKESLNIKNKTYQVFMYDGEKGEVHYVSQELSFDNFLKEHGILEVSNVDKFNFYSVTDQVQSEKWWVRQIGPSQKILIYATAEELSHSYGRSLNQENKILNRVNGKGEIFEFRKSLEAKFYLNLTGYKTERSFKSKSYKKYYSDPRMDIYYECMFHERSIVGEKRAVLTQEDLHQNLVIEIDGIARHLEEAFEMIYQVHQGESFWTLALKIPAKRIKIELLPRASATFIKTGLYKRECVSGFGPKVNVKQANTEGMLELSLETYVEKL